MVLNYKFLKYVKKKKITTFAIVHVLKTSCSSQLSNYNYHMTVTADHEAC